MKIEGLDLGLLLGVLVGEGSFGGDGRQPSVTVRMHTRHEALFRRLCDIVPGGRLYGPYDHSGRKYFQWIVRGQALRRLVPVLDHHLTPSLDAHAADRYARMKRTYARALAHGQDVEPGHPPDMIVRAARRGDGSRLADLVTELGYPTTPDTLLERLSAIQAQPDAATLVADTGADIVGFAGLRAEPLYEDDRLAARITALSVDADHRRRGVGTRLVRAAQDWAEQRGCASLVLASANHRAGAHAFYVSLGFAPSGARFSKGLTEDRDAAD